jgi:hypothetical protein
VASRAGEYCPPDTRYAHTTDGDRPTQHEWSAPPSRCASGGGWRQQPCTARGAFGRPRSKRHRPTALRRTLAHQRARGAGAVADVCAVASVGDVPAWRARGRACRCHRMLHPVPTASSADLRSRALRTPSAARTIAWERGMYCAATYRHPTVGRRRGTTRLLKRCNIAVASARYNLSSPQVPPALLRRVPRRGVPRVLDDGERRRRPVLQACSGRGHISDRSRVIG